jgi:hypothetical protein
MRVVQIIALMAGLCFLSTSAWAAKGWEVIDRDDGIVVSVKEVQGRSLPIFRGRGIVKGYILDVLAVLSDSAARSTWVKPCMEAKSLKVIDEFNRVVYDRTDAPWPVSDRDVVVRSKVQIDHENGVVHVGFQSDPTTPYPIPDGVVRMTRLRGFYHLVVKGPERTEVTYQIDTDPGGMLPDWVIRLASRGIPRDTLSGLREQVAKTRASGIYRELIATWTLLHVKSAESPASDAPPAPAEGPSESPPALPPAAE